MKRKVWPILLLGAVPMLYGQTPAVRQSPGPAPAAPQAAAPDAPLSKDAALARCKELLQQKIDIAQSYLDYVNKQYQLAAQSYLDTFTPQFFLTEVEAELAEFEGGLVPALPPSPGTAEATAARARYRASLASLAAMAQKQIDAAKTKYQLGTGAAFDVNLAQSQLLDAQLEMAAFDAGLYWPARARVAPR